MALSNNTLSGCFAPILAKGLTDFLLVQAAVIISSMPSTAVFKIRRDIRTSRWLCGDSRPRLSTERSSVFLPPLNLLQRRFRSRLQQFLCILSWVILTWIAMTEHGVARPQDFPARPHHVAHRVEPHSAIYFDAVTQPALAANLS